MIYGCKECTFVAGSEAVVRLHRKNMHKPTEHLLEPLEQRIADALKEEFGSFLRASPENWLQAAKGVVAKAKIGGLLFVDDQVHYYLEDQDMGNDKGTENYVEVYERTDGKWDWREKAPRGNLPDEVVSNSAGQGYDDEGAATEAAERENPGQEIRVVPLSS